MSRGLEGGKEKSFLFRLAFPESGVPLSSREFSLVPSGVVFRPSPFVYPKFRGSRGSSDSSRSVMDYFVHLLRCEDLLFAPCHVLLFFARFF